MIYKIKCPKCDLQADSLMKKDGIKGTYRELYTKYSPYRVNCSSCGLLKEIEDLILNMNYGTRPASKARLSGLTMLSTLMI